MDNHEFGKRPLDPYIELLCGEGPDAHSRGVGFRHSVHISDIGRRNAESSTNTSHSAVGWGNKGIGTWEEKTYSLKIASMQTFTALLKCEHC